MGIKSKLLTYYRWGILKDNNRLHITPNASFSFFSNKHDAQMVSRLIKDSKPIKIRFTLEGIEETND